MDLRHGWSASLIDWDRTRNGRSPDERSLRRCNSLKLDAAEEVQRRVRQKSLYLRDSSDMNHTPDQVRRSIVHVLNEWAKAGNLWDERIFGHNWLSKSDRIGQDLCHAHEDYWSGPRHATARGNTSAPTQIDCRLVWAWCWKWRNPVGPANDMQVGFLHRPKTRHLRATACWCVRSRERPKALPPGCLSPGATLGGRVLLRAWSSLAAFDSDRGAVHHVRERRIRLDR
jgi:hypothetical protein